MDLQEFKIKVYPVRDKLFRLAKMMLQNREEAEDTLQEVFLKLWMLRQGLPAYNSIEALAMKMTKNACLNKLKSQKVKKMVDVNELEVDSGYETPYKTLERQDDMNTMYAIFEELPHQQKLIMHLRNVEGYSFEEIEQITGLSINNIRVILSRARQQVKESYLKLNNYEID
ncbi:sigma-70 family RNA polymerase sigma factor [Rhodocytophaga rosea]|uniref:Sigma-70 family RNA polymerase sigma factor n=1 Tax=Rhodocytophaga rosea TaxID=2704465 RepID=A0A6C0GLA1_9BACT|nr:sigma-70 family RNA polymerase sigma factor [Rhodocytophaga rosea]QHT68594.1 sigma-70 family RNA polymerase sigma factor [Rhodocytophaga rosea]